MKKSIFLVSLIIFLSGCSRKTIIYNNGIHDYTKVFQKAITVSNHIIIKPGIYYLKGTIYLESNIIIEGEGEVTLVKDSLYSHVFTNYNAVMDYAEKWNTSIYIRNLSIDVKNNGNQDAAIHHTANGNLSFKFVKDLRLDNIKIINGDSLLFGLHLQSVKNVEVRNYKYEGDKDGVHINGGSSNILVDGFDISSLDDAFGVMTDDYPRVQHNAQDIRNITIKNGISRKHSPQYGFLLRLMTGSWKDWEKGNNYKIGHTTNCQNRQYKKINTGDMVSLVEPKHLSGDSTYPDGIEWRYIGPGINNTSNIYNVSVLNVESEDRRVIVRTINSDEYDYGEYPGTENTSVVEGLYIENNKLNVTRGKTVKWKTLLPSDYYSLSIMIISPYLLVIIVMFYFRSKKISFYD